ncbi:MAG: hypothetical protein P8R54_11175 [Myxococcota bacterium]|nr:hypothetical protein [Myxococcota bacterium]
MLHLQIRYSSSHRATLTGAGRWQPYGDGSPVPPGLAVVTMVSPPHGAELRALDATGIPLSLETLHGLCQRPIIGNQLTLFV